MQESLLEHIAKAKQAAHNAVNQAIRQGKLLRPSICGQCGKIGRTDGHHKDYSKPLEVIWLCRSCHGQLHPFVPLVSHTDQTPHPTKGRILTCRQCGYVWSPSAKYASPMGKLPKTCARCRRSDWKPKGMRYYVGVQTVPEIAPKLPALPT